MNGPPGVPLPDVDCMAELTPIPGIGPWSAPGALLIALRREDVGFPGDLEPCRAVQRFYHLTM